MELMGALSYIAANGTVADALAVTGMAAAEAAPTALAVGGLGLAGVGMYQQGQSAAAAAEGQQAVSEYNAAVAKQSAKAEEQATLYKQGQQEKDAQRLASSQLASIGASGAVSTAGTPLMLQGVQAEQSELDNLMIGYQGEIAKRQKLNQSAIDTAQAGIYGTQAGNSRMAGTIGAGSMLLSGVGEMAYKKRYG